MTPRALNSAIEIYARWVQEQEKTPLDRVVNAEVRSRRYLNSRERRWVQSVLFTTLRLLRRQKHLCSLLKRDATAENLIRITAMEQSEEDTSFLPLEEWKAALAQLPTREDASGYLRISLSYPDNLAQDLETVLGADAIAEGEALNQQAPTTLRVNTLKTTRESLLERLEEATPTHYSPWGITLSHRSPVNLLPGYEEGFFEIQEEASQLVALLSEVEPGQRVLEVGAGGGGKTLTLCAMMQNQGTLYALDSSKLRLDDLEKRVERVQAKQVIPILVETKERGLWKKTVPALPSEVDCIFIDAPCTGTGALRRNPDAKWREVNIPRFVELQSALITQSAPSLKPGGLLCYVTCAFESSQNEEVVEAFLNSEAGANFEKEPLPAAFQAFDSGGYFRSWSSKHGLDAFFMARLRKRVD